MKPLELTMFPPLKWPRTGSEIDPYRKQWHHEREIIQSKRFTDGELAAEYWRLRLKVCASGNADMKAKGHVCIEWQAAHDELDIMQRFMELPSYDEEPKL